MRKNTPKLSPQQGLAFRAARAGVATATAVLVTATGLALAAPASADVIDKPVIEMLGWSEQMSTYNDEWRADFTVRVPAGTVPKSVQYNASPANPASWTTLTKLANAQTSVGQAYSIMHTMKDGDEDVLYIGARGDATVPAVTKSVAYPMAVRVTLANGSVVTGTHTVTNVGRNATTGVPAVVQAWDSTTSRLANYVGPNAQVGWGNVVAENTSGELDGSRFHVDAINSGRSAANGCNVTDSVYYQFVRGDTGEAASITPTPKQIAIPNHTSGVKGVLLAAEGKFALDAPGYYKLMIWPQATSSSATAPQDCSLVSYNPALLSEGVQVGSVLWKAPASAPVVVAPVTVDALSDGTALAVTKPTFSGTGHPGAAIEARTADGALHGTATVGADGTWSLVSSIEHANGDHTVTITQTSGTDVSTASAAYSVDVEIPVTPVSIVSPATNGVIAEINPVYSGVGHPGATITVRGSTGRVLATTTVDENGKWSATSTIALVSGLYVGTVEQTFGASSTNDALRYTITIAEAAPVIEFAVAKPVHNGLFVSKTPTYFGTGTPGASIEVKGNSGRIVATTTVDAEGNWSATSTLTLTAGRYIGTVSQTIGGDVKIEALDYRIAKDATVTSPAIEQIVSGPRPTYTGTGEPDATVQIVGNSGRVVASTVVGADGTWSVQANFDLVVNWYLGTMVHSYEGETINVVSMDYTILD